MATMDTAPAPSGQSPLRRYWWLVGLVIAIAVVVVLAPAASSDPDGLDRVAQDQAFAETAEDPAYAFLPDYSVPGIDDEYWSLIAAGLTGVAIVFIVAVLLGAFLRMSRRGRAP
ncbi:MAG TPA: PDGLE domain-containing protein [Tepidiformaceae bacterium]|nr:PDGLE domain-containing protein [Tepidiformaceae bacterium]